MKKPLLLKYPAPLNPPECKKDDFPPHLCLKYPGPPPLVERYDYSGGSLDEDSCSDSNEDENHMCVPVSKTCYVI